MPAGNGWPCWRPLTPSEKVSQVGVLSLPTARRVLGLYVIREAADVTGWLGGYNFQSPSAGGWAAGQAV